MLIHGPRRFTKHLQTKGYFFHPRSKRIKKVLSKIQRRIICKRPVRIKLLCCVSNVGDRKWHGRNIKVHQRLPFTDFCPVPRSLTGLSGGANPT